MGMESPITQELELSTIFVSSAQRQGKGGQETAPASTELWNTTVAMANTYTPKRGYVLTLHYVKTGQQAVGLRSFISQQCWLGSFDLPMYIVEPFIEDSLVHTAPDYPDFTGNVLRMSDFFDMDHYASASRKEGWGEVVSWDSYKQNAPRNVIIVHSADKILHCKCMSTAEEPRQPPEIEWAANSTHSCYEHPIHESKYLPGNDFCIVRILKTFPSPYICSAKEMHEIIFGPWRPDEITLIFERWCPSTYIPNPKLTNPDICKKACERGLDEKFYASARLQRQAETYEKLYQEGQTSRVVIMLRTEHVVLSTKMNDSKLITLDTCLKKVVNRTDALKTRSKVRPLVTVDVGRYGSTSWDRFPQTEAKYLIKMVKNATLALVNANLTFEEWEDTFSSITAGITDRGYIAALQKTVASRADCLMILGGGNFVRLALHEYLNNHPDSSKWCLELVCLEERFKQEYDDIINERQSTYSLKWEKMEKEFYSGSLIISTS